MADRCGTGLVPPPVVPPPELPPVVPPSAASGEGAGAGALSVGSVSSPRSGFALGDEDFFLSPCSVSFLSSVRSTEPQEAPGDAVPPALREASGDPAAAPGSSEFFSRARMTPVAASTTVTATAASRTRPLPRPEMARVARVGEVAQAAWPGRPREASVPAARSLRSRVTRPVRQSAGRPGARTPGCRTRPSTEQNRTPGCRLFRLPEPVPLAVSFPSLRAGSSPPAGGSPPQTPLPRSPFPVPVTLGEVPTGPRGRGEGGSLQRLRQGRYLAETVRSARLGTAKPSRSARVNPVARATSPMSSAPQSRPRSR